MNISAKFLVLLIFCNTQTTDAGNVLGGISSPPTHTTEYLPRSRRHKGLKENISPEQALRNLINASIKKTFQEIFKREPDEREKNFFTAIRERVLLQCIFAQKDITDSEFAALMILNAALRHVFTHKRSIDSFVYALKKA